jgi:predicted GH43/DUF377 family glycosyl hydrolase
MALSLYFYFVMKDLILKIICGIALLLSSVSYVFGQSKMMMYGDSDRRGTAYTKNPFVIKYKQCYWMYYSIAASPDGTKGWALGIASSRDLIHWKKVGELLPSPDCPAESKGISAPCAIIRNDTIHLFYQTYGNGTADAICHAWSTDALHFERDASNPVFRPSPTWNCGRAIDAEVCLYKGKYYMYYATRDKDYRKQMLGVAVTSSTSSFAKGSFKEACKEAIMYPALEWEGDCIEAPSVIKRNNHLYMFYAGNYNNSPQQIGIAESWDGISWKRCQSTPFLRNGREGEWNSSESGHPGIFDDGRKSYLFYEGNCDKGKTWYLSNVRVYWNAKGPYLKR